MSRKKRDDQYDPHSPKWCEARPMRERFEWQWLPFPELRRERYRGLELRQPIRGENYRGEHVYELVKAARSIGGVCLYHYLLTRITFETRLERNEFLSKAAMRGNQRERRRKARAA